MEIIKLPPSQPLGYIWKASGRNLLCNVHVVTPSSCYQMETLGSGPMLEAGRVALGPTSPPGGHHPQHRSSTAISRYIMVGRGNLQCHQKRETPVSSECLQEELDQVQRCVAGHHSFSGNSTFIIKVQRQGKWSNWERMRYYIIKGINEVEHLNV